MIYNQEQDFMFEFVEGLPVGIATVDLNEKMPNHYNDFFLKLFGWDNNDISTVDEWFEKAYPDEKYKNEVIKNWKKIASITEKNGLPYSPPMETKIYCKNGNIKFCECRYYRKDNFMYGIFTDITSKKTSENNLKEAQKLSKMGSWELDIVNNKVYWSDEIYRIFEMVRYLHKSTYVSFLKLVHPEDRKAVNSTYLYSIIHHEPYDFEHRLLFPDGRVKYVHQRGITEYDGDCPILSRGTVQDITDRKQLQFDMETRIKELDCMYRVTETIHKKHISIKEFLSEAVKIIPDGLDCSNKINIVITVDDCLVKLNNFRTKKCIGTSLITIDDKVRGAITVFCASDNNSFEKHEQDLLDAIANILGDKIENHEYEEKTLYLSRHDPLTGLYNRLAFDEKFKYEIERSDRYKRDLSLLIFDIDHFKNVNDTYGHPIGDMVLQDLSNLISRSLRKNDIFCRFGGEEFTILLPETHEENAVKIAEKLRKRVQNYKFKYGENDDEYLNLTISIGITTYPTFDTPSKILSEADKKLYTAKNTGRNKVCYREKVLDVL